MNRHVNHHVTRHVTHYVTRHVTHYVTRHVTHHMTRHVTRHVTHAYDPSEAIRLGLPGLLSAAYRLSGSDGQWTTVKEFTRCR